MAHILYLHGSAAGPYGRKTEWLEENGHRIVGRPRLPYPLYPRRSWRWLLAYLDRRWFARSVAAAQEAYDRCRPDVIVGSSMGGAVAMNLNSARTPQVLIAPAWRARPLLCFGRARRVKPATVVLHGEGDRTVWPRSSRALLANSRPGPVDLPLVAEVERRLRDRIAQEGGGYQLDGRLLLVEGEDHRCNRFSALRALLAAVEVLAALPGEAPQTETDPSPPIRHE